MIWLWIGLGVILGLPLAFSFLFLLIYFYLKIKFLDFVLRIFQERPLFIIPRGQPVKDAQGNAVTEDAKTTTQTLAMGPVASQESIKMLGTNGGGFFNANSAHPYENPTALANFVQMLAIFLILRRRIIESVAFTGLKG